MSSISGDVVPRACASTSVTRKSGLISTYCPGAPTSPSTLNARPWASTTATATCARAMIWAVRYASMIRCSRSCSVSPSALICPTYGSEMFPLSLTRVVLTVWVPGPDRSLISTLSRSFRLIE
jgi:hypothetical protein